MPFISTSPALHRHAQRRTELLHGMLLARHFTECRSPVPVPGRADLAMDIDHGEEAMLVGVAAALGPADTLIRSALPVGHLSACPVGAAGALLVCVHDHLPGDRRHLRVLFRGAEPATGCGCPPGRPVDGLDVEAVLDRARDTAQAVRCGGSPRQMELDMSGRLDAIAVLAHRMCVARELDDNALHAVDDHTIRLVRTALAACDAAPR